MESKYAPAERADLKQVQEDFKFLKNIEYIEKLINSLPYIGAVLNQQRQVVFANEKLLEIMNIRTIENILGQRPGEVLNCVNADREIGGCGTSENCSVCGAVNCILEAQKHSKKVTSECRITTKKENVLTSFDLKVTTTPFLWHNEVFYVFSMVDISNKKRRLAMERIFFHDVINKTGSMHGFIDLLKNEKDIGKIHKFIDFMDTINQDLTNEIMAQRDLSSAENGELQVSLGQHNTYDIIRNSSNQISSHDVAKNKMVFTDAKAESHEITTDGTLLRRILMNMLKNALEATSAGGAVSIGCIQENTILKFWVHNDTLIPKESQLQIFQRSFSTKGSDRGLGTYSMKLLGEQYLKGEVGFESTAENGTVFFIELPFSSA